MSFGRRLQVNVLMAMIVANPFAVFDQHSQLARPILHLFQIVGVIMGAILLLVTVLVLYASFRYRYKKGQGEPKQRFGDKKLEIAWTIAPLLILSFLFAATLLTMGQSDPAPFGRQPDLVIVAHQWWWEARYGASNAVVANEIHIPVNKLLYVRLESDDVIHDWWVPPLGRKMDAIPGHPNFMWLEADSPGSYLGTCAEYCGAEHAWMRILVVAEAEAEFNRWIAQQLQDADAAPQNDEAREGAKLFMQLTCPSCHSISSGSSTPSIGPNLAHIASRQTLAAGRLENTPVNLSRWLSDPQSVKPNSYMPNFQLSSTEVAQLTSYLETLR